MSIKREDSNTGHLGGNPPFNDSSTIQLGEAPSGDSVSVYQYGGVLYVEVSSQDRYGETKTFTIDVERLQLGPHV